MISPVSTWPRVTAKSIQQLRYLQHEHGGDGERAAFGPSAEKYRHTSAYCRIVSKLSWLTRRSCVSIRAFSKPALLATIMNTVDPPRRAMRTDHLRKTFHRR